MLSCIEDQVVHENRRFLQTFAALVRAVDMLNRNQSGLTLEIHDLVLESQHLANVALTEIERASVEELLGKGESA